MHLPPEIWRIIFEDVKFEKAALSSVSLTCRYLHSIAQTITFREFYLSMSHIQTDKDLARKIARLGFYASNTIAPLVLNLSISVCVRPRDSIEIAAVFFNALPRFLNIRSLACYGIHFTQLGLQRVSSLPSLDMLDVKSCTFLLDSDLSPMLRPRTVSLGSRGIYHMDNNWLALLNPNSLQELHIPFTPYTCAFFLACDNPILFPFPSLHTIKGKTDRVTLPQLPQLFSKSPALRCLKPTLVEFGPPLTAKNVRITARFESPLPCSVPYHEEYNGPHPAVLGQSVDYSSAHIRRLVFDADVRWDDPLGTFVNMFKTCHPLQLKDLTHLQLLSFSSMDLKAFTTLQDMFPALQELHIHSEKHGEFCRGGQAYWFPRHLTRSFPIASVNNVHLADLYALPLPRSLMSLSIQWMSDRDATDTPNLVEAKDNLLSRLPSLRRLWLCDLSTLALLWSRTSSGKDEYCSLHEVGSSDKISSAWRMRDVVFSDIPDSLSD